MIHHINLRVISHSTEDKSKVKEALDFFLNNSLEDRYSLLNENIVTSIDAQGHYGNPLSIFSAQLTQKSHKESFIKFIYQNMSREDLNILKNEISQRLDDDQIFYIRFDKQAAFLNKIKLSTTSDCIITKIKIETYPKNILKAGKIVEELFG